ncbi:LCP family protein [Umezawaea tangerina]|uniref:LytR family transcriptional attenuator n=1 Tax=Umezawaea tangerina TaxID=84725 RepID=A0A2T0TDX1_9PSEU|nr:LCP family protein [Umezawaea tangerina]PRY43824.1 LytR family transcriptional attenuator [Umezawaea tangerina]
MRAVLAFARVLVALLSAAVLVAAGYGWVTLKRVKESVNTTDVISVLSDVPNSPPLRDGATDILLVGSDSRTDAQGNQLPPSVLRQLRTEASDGVNTDTIIVLRVPTDGGRATAVSIPRDTYVPIPDYREDKINQAYGVTKYATIQRLRDEGVGDAAEREKQGDQAGRKALVQVVQDLTGIRVDHYAEINLYGFYLLTDVIGGVDVCLNSGTSDSASGANFRAGPQRVTGGDALAFVRQRNLPGGDLGRIRRQQVFLSAAVSQLLSAGTFTDQEKLAGLLDAARKSIVVDDGLDLVALAQQARGMAGGTVEFATIPVTDVNARNDRGQSIVTVDVAAVKAFVAERLGPANTLVPVTTTTTAPPSPTQRFAGGKVVGVDGARRAAQPDVPCVD